LIVTRRHFVGLSVAAALAGCAGGDPLTNELLAQKIAPGSPRKSLCAISAIGDTFSVQKMGVTVFGNALDMAQIDTWGIDEFVVGKVAAQLSRRFDAKRLTYPKGAFAALDKPKSPFAEPKDDRKDIMRGIAGGKNCDLVVAVTKSGSMIGNSNQHVVGLGILDMSSVIFTNVSVFALPEMRVYDGQTFAVLGYKKAFDWQKGILGTHIIRGAQPAGRQDLVAGIAGTGRVRRQAQEGDDGAPEQGIAIMIADLFPQETAAGSAQR
jgi:hypothetical protein